MPSPSLTRAAGRLLIAVGASAFLVLIIIGITGGFTLRAGPLHFAAHGWRGPFVIALAAFAAAAVPGRAVFLDAASAIWQFADDHALALAIVIAAATAGAGMACATYAASSSDASGYISEGRLLSAAQLSSDEPLARAVAWPNATWAFSPLGYRPGSEPGELVPTYPAGLPLAIAPVQLLGGELAAYLVVPFLGGIAVLSTYAAGARLHSRITGLAAATFLATSPVFLFQLVQPMSDVAVTAWWSVALLFALSPLPTAPMAAGAAAGLALLTRPNLAPMAIVSLLAAMNVPRGGHERRVRPDRALAFLGGMTPAVGALLLMQWRLYGNPLMSGYGSASDLFAASSIAPNLAGYTNRILHGEGPALGVAAIALAVIVIARRKAVQAPPLKRPLLLALLAAAILLISYLPYAVFAEWSYLRFLLPAFPLLFIVVGALLVNALLQLPRPVRGIVFATVLTVATSLNIVRAQQEQAFNLQRYESRYRLAGRYLDATLPPNAVVVTAQESGSARYYANVPILRWDLVDVDLDTALAALRAIGRHPVLLVEDWETPELARKFPRSLNARVDWPARAEFGDETRVFLYDPVDRDITRPWRADRVH